MLDIDKRSLGVTFSNGSAHVRIWAPEAKSVDLCITKSCIPLVPENFGYWSIITEMLKPGDEYNFILNGKTHIPDPCSLSQPNGVHGASQAIDVAKLIWTDQDWANHPLHNYIFYEVHTGTFSAEGNFQGIIDHIEHLVSLGITAIELMPVTQFPGKRNWGYDGVFPFAVHRNYGGAEGLQQLINVCHANHIAVVLDVVYNHMGPEGNYLPESGHYFTEKYKTPWGAAINFDDEHSYGVRNYFIENALMWLRDFHVDALRLDAVHAIRDFGASHFLQELKQRVDQLSGLTGKNYYLIVECDLNDPKYIRPLNQYGYGMDAQWLDEFHHALRVTCGQKREGYYEDFKGIADLAKSYTDAYVYDGQFSKHRHRNFGLKTNGAGEQFVVFSQNHDQIGNRMLGERISKLMGFEMLKLMAGAVILSPYLPLLFMGEEWAETNPFQYFVSHTNPELTEAVRKGRRDEFKDFHYNEEVPDPLSETTFNNSKLQWHLHEQEGIHTVMFQYYKELIRIRKTYLPSNIYTREHLEVSFNETDLTLLLYRWQNNKHIYCLMNFSEAERVITLPGQDPLYCLLNSADVKWNGPGNQNTLIESASTVLTPQSIVVYSNYV